MDRILFVTGGHYTPAKAVMDEILKEAGWKIYYLGRRFAFEGDKAPSFEYLELRQNRQINFLEITTGRLQRKFTVYTLLSLVKFPLGFAQSLYWTHLFHPKVVLSFGGYLALPVSLAAWILKVPIVTHEQTIVFGLSNKIIQLLASKVLVSFRSSLPHIDGSKWVFTGNPLRKDIFNVSYDKDLESLDRLKRKTALPVVFITGGKEGSHILNEEIAQNLQQLSEHSLLIIQTGSSKHGDYEKINSRVGRLSPELGERIKVFKFISSRRIGAVYKTSDLVVSRAGANTVFELAALGKPGVLVPLPWSGGGEQRKNAQELAQFGAAEIVEQADLKDELVLSINMMLTRLPELRRKALRAKVLVVARSARLIEEIVLKLAR